MTSEQKADSNNITHYFKQNRTLDIDEKLLSLHKHAKSDTKSTTNERQWNNENNNRRNISKMIDM